MSHIRQFHGTYFCMLKCPYCEKQFSRMLHLKEHCGKKHSGMLIPEEQECKLSFRNTKKMQKERVQERGNVKRAPRLCGYCGKNLSGKFNLNRHIQRSHTNNTDQQNWKKGLIKKFLK